MGPAWRTKLNFDSTTISTVTPTYATSFAGTYDSYATASAPAANAYRFVKVVASANVALSFLPVLPNISNLYTVSASATAGQQALSSLTNGGLLPFTPDAHNIADTTNFGLTPGTSYALKWPKNGSSSCSGDIGWVVPGSPPSEHGFVDIGEGNSNSKVRSAIVNGGYPNANSSPSSLVTGDSLGGVPGNRGSSIFDALDTRATQDTDDISTTYAVYKSGGTGNGRRLVTVAIGGAWSGNGNNAANTIVGFANFFLNTSYSGTSGGICATYVGPANITSAGAGGTGGTKIYANHRLCVEDLNAATLCWNSRWAFPFFWMLFSGVYQIGYAYYVYDRLAVATENAALLGARLTYDSSNASAFSTSLKNMVLYGSETAGTYPVVRGLTTANVAVDPHLDGNWIPRYITVNITGYSINALFKTFSLPNKPGATGLYYGQYNCSAC